jgi:hypothetical protein
LYFRKLPHHIVLPAREKGIAYHALNPPLADEGSPCGSLTPPIVIPAKAGIQLPYLFIIPVVTGSRFSSGWNSNALENNLLLKYDAGILLFMLLAINKPLYPAFSHTGEKGLTKDSFCKKRIYI